MAKRRNQQQVMLEGGLLVSVEDEYFRAQREAKQEATRKDKTVAALWKHNGWYPTEVMFIRRSGRIRFYQNVSKPNIERMERLRVKGDRRIRWELKDEIDRALARAAEANNG